MMLQQDYPEDFVIATGIQYSVRDFILWSAKELGVIIEFEGQGLNELGVVRKIQGDKCPSLSIGDVIIKIDERYFRPLEVETLLGDPTKAEKVLGWKPQVSAQEMCAEMVASDLQLAQKTSLLLENGF